MPYISIKVFVISPILLGAGILVLSLAPVQGLIRGLPSGGGIRRNWYILTGLIVFFIAGYLWYALELWQGTCRFSDLIVSAVFFLGACFVLLVNYLSHRTARDIRRITLLEQEIITDATMGIHNRRYFEQRLKEEFDRAQRYQLPLALLLIDIDDFKRINDVSGHLAGDLVLKHLGRLLLASVRDTDIITRYGGDEICIIATHTNDATALELAKRIRSLVERSVVTGDSGREEFRTTVSIGVASLSPGLKEPSELVDHADKALYRSKHEGKNRITVYPPPAAEHGETTPHMAGQPCF
ncbi:GGDEF domain-containing protein [Geobacter sp. FeAm09]|uniref:GGDEF domain-containing protein n=1 Tax=Geobacter sp. FeAm09 TaxID=2597769 RepID=UPI0011ED2BDC|nr:GGDEF domain-containing protein [Geobacter sp. FeAm09]QEM67769.1 GGDEF domain-containing protein [Geobacter sp. FeAm09]